MMNKTQALELFEREAVLFGEVEGIPEARATALLGAEAVQFAHRMDATNRSYLFNGYGIGNYTAMYITLQGFYIAVTYNNVASIEKAAEGDSNTPGDKTQ